ncbi:3-O-alpha-D-mannopyranosyl-alpha-D-mannopyranose xylosylphosphotransferase [Cercospora zeina]
MHRRLWSSSSGYAKSHRGRPITIWLIVFSFVLLCTLLLSTIRLANEANGQIRKRSEPLQVPIQPSTAEEPRDDPPSTPSPPSVDTPSEPSSENSSPKHVNNDPQPMIESAWLNTPDTLAFPSYAKYAALVDNAESLPEIIYVAFEDAVKDDVLVGWEAEWLMNATYSTKQWGMLKEPRIDFVYTWVNGSEEAFRATKRPYELNSTLNDREGTWIGRHGENRYRDWNELKYSVRSVETFAPFRNKIQLLVNSLEDRGGSQQTTKQVPAWLNEEETKGIFEVLAQEEFFREETRDCLPSFNSLTIENELHNTDSGVDRMFALSDDMLLGRHHAASDIYSPLYGPLFAFKTNAYNTLHRPNEADAQRFGEKPWLIYTSWLLNRRFGSRKRKGQAHFGHSLSRKLHREAMLSFPKPQLQSACSRFRGDFGFQLYSWYASFHYTIERHREVLLWSYLMHRSDQDQNGYLSWPERQQIITDLWEGLQNVGGSYRTRQFYHLPENLEDAGLQPPKVNLDILWTSMDGPVTTKDVDCLTFDVNECLAPGFSAEDSTASSSEVPVFSTAAILDRVARESPGCGDCLIKILLHRQKKGFAPMMPFESKQPKEFEIVVKALVRYQYAVHEPDALFVMVTDAEQVETTLIKRLLTNKKKVGQLCLNDDVASQIPEELEDLQKTITALFEGLLPKPSRFELPLGK